MNWPANAELHLIGSKLSMHHLTTSINISLSQSNNILILQKYTYRSSELIHVVTESMYTFISISVSTHFSHLLDSGNYLSALCFCDVSFFFFFNFTSKWYHTGFIFFCLALLTYIMPFSVIYVVSYGGVFFNIWLVLHS